MNKFSIGHITDLEFSVSNDTLEYSYIHSISKEAKDGSVNVETLESWGIDNTDIFSGQAEDFIGYDYDGNPIYEGCKWNYESFDELPTGSIEALVKEYIVWLELP